ncbi:MAG: hypothetical protein ACREPZ_10375, partial [Rhodanobacteraceae bacterium]
MSSIAPTFGRHGRKRERRGQPDAECYARTPVDEPLAIRRWQNRLYELATGHQPSPKGPSGGPTADVDFHPRHSSLFRTTRKTGHHRGG